MVLKKTEDEEQNVQLVAPDGGWGYVVVGATVIIFGVTVIPVAAFGLIYGPFLNSIGDETTGTTLSNAIFNTVYSFTGLLANGLLSRYSYRKVGFIGAITFIVGALGLIFIRNLFHLIVCFGLLEGIGFGLLMPASLSAFNAYFDKRIAVMMSLCQALMIALNMMVPQVIEWCMTILGFRGTLTGLCLWSVLCLPAVATLQPVKRHMRKVPVQPSINSTAIPMETIEETTGQDNEEPLLENKRKPAVNLGDSRRSLHSIDHDRETRPRKSIISLGDRVASVTKFEDLNEAEEAGKESSPFWQSLCKSMDFSLLKDATYLNISIGLALAFTGDMAFISIIPLMLRNLGFESKQVAFLLGVFFCSDFVSRILLTIVSGIVKLRSRLVVLFASVFIVLARTALVSNDTYIWKLLLLGALGFLRCFIQTPLPLVFSEEYQDRFASAYSLFMAINGVVNLIFGPLMGAVKSVTDSDVMVSHVLTLAYIICIVSWIIELTFCRKKRPAEGPTSTI